MKQSTLVRTRLSTRIRLLFSGPPEEFAISSWKGDVLEIRGWKEGCALPPIIKLNVDSAENRTNPDSRTIMPEAIKQTTDTTHVMDNGKVIDPTTDKVRILRQCSGAIDKRLNPSCAEP